MTATQVRDESQRRWLLDPAHHARVEHAVGVTEQAITNGGRFTEDDRQIARAAASAALVLADLG